MHLKRVKLGTVYHLHYPKDLKTNEGTGRGGPGYVVDWDAPWEREWCAGQEHKLEDVPKGDAGGPSEITNPKAKRRILEILDRVPDPPKTVADQTRENDAGAGGVSEDDIPDANPPARKKRGRRKKAEKKDGAE